MKDRYTIDGFDLYIDGHHVGSIHASGHEEEVGRAWKSLNKTYPRKRVELIRAGNAVRKAMRDNGAIFP